MYFNDEKIDRVKNYINKLSLRGNNAKISEALLNYIECSYNEKSEKYEIIKKLLWDKKTKHINEVFSGNKSEILKNIFGDKNGTTLKKYGIKQQNICILRDITEGLTEQTKIQIYI